MHVGCLIVFPCSDPKNRTDNFMQYWCVQPFAKRWTVASVFKEFRCVPHLCMKCFYGAIGFCSSSTFFSSESCWPFVSIISTPMVDQTGLHCRRSSFHLHPRSIYMECWFVGFFAFHAHLTCAIATKLFLRAYRLGDLLIIFCINNINPFLPCIHPRTIRHPQHV